MLDTIAPDVSIALYGRYVIMKSALQDVPDSVKILSQGTETPSRAGKYGKLQVKGQE